MALESQVKEGLKQSSSLIEFSPSLGGGSTQRGVRVSYLNWGIFTEKYKDHAGRVALETR